MNDQTHQTAQTFIIIHPYSSDSSQTMSDYGGRPEKPPGTARSMHRQEGSGPQ